MQKYLLIALALAASHAGAAQLTIEDDGWRPASLAVSQLIDQQAPDIASLNCRPYQVQHLTGSLSVAIPQVACWGAASAPLWVMELSPKPKLLMAGSAYRIYTSGVNTRHPGLTLSTETAGRSTVSHWVYLGHRYQEMAHD